MAKKEMFERKTISLPRKLKRRMDIAPSSVNWSAVACDAFEAKLAEIEAGESTPRVQDSILARRLQIIDDKGRPAITLGCEDGMPAINIMDGEKSRAKLHLTPKGPAFVLSDNDGVKRFIVGVLNTEEMTVPKLELFDGDGCRKAALITAQNGTSALMLFDSSGARRLLAGIANDNPEFHVCDAEQKIAWKAPSRPPEANPEE